ncbi:MAG: ClpXP protease specificity-enhancing factor [Steroidobacteraceae bacterium]
MSSRRPYLVRAMHEWMTDNLQTPHLIVDALAANLEIPRQFVQDGKIILNISFNATQNLVMGNERIEFNARFGGKTHHVVVPVPALLGVYARESGQGLVFGDEDVPPSQPTPPDSATDSSSSDGAPITKSAPRGRAQLKVVK